MNEFFRSLIFYTGLFPLTVLFSFISIFILPLSRSRRYKIICGWARSTLWWLKITNNLEWEVEGLEKIPNQNGIIMCKHQSAWETIALQLIFPKQSQVLKKELFLIPFFGWALASLNPIAINRQAGVKSIKKIQKEAKKRIEDGWWVLIFPEGTRMPVGRAGEYRRTAPAIAKMLNCPLVPVAHNAGVFWPKNSFLKKKGTIRVIIGDPIFTDELSSKEATSKAKNWIEKTCSKLPSKIMLKT